MLENKSGAVIINWALYKRLYGKKWGYRLPLTDDNGTIIILVLREKKVSELRWAMELGIYPHNKPVQTVFYFANLKEATDSVVDALAGVKPLGNIDLTGMRVVEPVGSSRGKQTVRTIRC